MSCICGKKCSYFCLIISIWGTFQLILMGICYGVNSLAFLHSLPLEEHYASLESFRSDADHLYFTLAIRCFVTAIVYAIFAVISYVCLRMRRKQRARKGNQF